MATVAEGTGSRGVAEWFSSAVDRYFPGENMTIESVKKDPNGYVIGKVWGLDRPAPRRGETVEHQPYHGVYWPANAHLSMHQNDWFDRLVEANWRKYILPFAGRIDSYLEIGVCEGRSMRWVMDHIQPSSATGIDPYEPGRGRQTKAFKRYEEFVAKNLAPWRNIITMVKARSHEYLRGVLDGQPCVTFPPDQSFDMIYVDGDHRGQFTMTDLVLSWWKLKIDGIMVIDDYNARWRHSQPATWEAATGFFLAFDHLFDYVYRTRKQVAIIKRKHG